MTNPIGSIYIRSDIIIIVNASLDWL